MKCTHKFGDKVRTAPVSNHDLCFLGGTHDPKMSRIMAGTTGLEPATSAVTVTL